MTTNAKNKLLQIFAAQWSDNEQAYEADLTLRPVLWILPTRAKEHALRFAYLCDWAKVLADN